MSSEYHDPLYFVSLINLRLKLFEDAKQKCIKLQTIYPSNKALQSISLQIDYLIELEINPIADRSRLSDIIIGVLTAREVEPLDEEVANIFHKFSAEAKKCSRNVFMINYCYSGEIMKLQSIKYQCEFFHEFKSVALPEGSYGEFLLWSSSGEKAYLDATSDKTYDEVSDLIDAYQNGTSLNDDARANILQKIYGPVACDLDHEGSAFSLVAHKPCPVCGALKMKSWDYENPTKVVDAEVAAVTHTVWMGLSTSEKARVVREAISCLEK